MSLSGDVVAAVLIIALLTRVDMLLAGFYYILKTLRLTD